MKTQSVLLFLSILFGSHLVAPGQVTEKGDSSAGGAGAQARKAKLVDEFIGGKCGDTLARTDSFIDTIRNNPGSTALVAIYSDAGGFRQADWVIRNHISVTRKFSGAAVIFQRGGSEDSAVKVQFWLVPLGAAAPEISPKPSEDDLPVFANIGKQTLFSSELENAEMPGCAAPLDVEGFAKVLASYPQYRARISIGYTSAKTGRETQRGILKALVDAGIKQSRISSTMKKSRTPKMELWLLP